MLEDRPDPRRSLLRHVLRDALLIGVAVTHLYLIRHAQARTNGGEGMTLEEAELTQVGWEQARRVAERLARQRLDALYASPLRRAQQTAEAISRATGLAVITRADLREVFIQAQTDAPQLNESQLRALAERIAREGTWDAFPGSEGSQAFRRRVQVAMDRMIEEHPGQRVAIVTHGGFIQTYVSLILGGSRDFIFYPFNTGITSIRAKGDRRVLWRLNDLAHLDGLVAGEGGISYG